MSKDTSPPAFPGGKKWIGTGAQSGHAIYETYGGMSLRDYFAAAAMQGFCSARQIVLYGDAADEAYRMADAMLKARATHDPS